MKTCWCRRSGDEQGVVSDVRCGTDNGASTSEAWSIACAAETDLRCAGSVCLEEDGDVGFGTCG